MNYSILYRNYVKFIIVNDKYILSFANFICSFIFCCILLILGALNIKGTVYVNAAA
jgi:hypothetical protein